jgi:hypothetical protein
MEQLPRSRLDSPKGPILGNTNVQCTNGQIKNGTAPQVQAGLSQGTYLEIQMFNVLIDR